MKFTAKAAATCLFCLGLTACASTNTDKSFLLGAANQPGKVQCETTSVEANDQVARATNTKRSWVGLHPIEANAKLANVAAQIACEMAKTGKGGKSGISFGTAALRAKKQGYSARIVAKNVSIGNHNLHSVLERWNNSDGYLQRVLTPQLRDVGIGSALASDGKTRIWTAVYAAE